MNTKFTWKKSPAGRKWLCVFLAVLSLLRQNRLLANPTGMTVVSGSATAQQLGSQLNIALSQAAVLNWQSFNIAAGETTAFLQPSANSVVLNLIGGANPSQIFGSLKANGTVILENANGFYFGPNSMVKVGGSFIATTAATPPDLGSGSGWQFTGMPPLASIVNYGQIEVGAGKSLFLIAENIENHGSLNAPGGNVELAAGQSVLVSDSPDGRGLSAKVKLPEGSVDNFGRVTADGGSLMLQAQVVNQDGLLQADSIQNKNGVIELVASDQLNLGANSQILARGDDSAAGSAGGSVTLKSENIFTDANGGEIAATGGAHGGNGGNIEISAPQVQSLNSAIDARAQAGGTAGKLLLDPDYIVLDTSGTGSAGSGTVLAGNNPGTTLDLNVKTAFAKLAVSQIILQAAYDITLAAGTTWNLSQTIGSASGGVTAGNLTLEAGRNIIFGKNSLITDANDWTVSLYAGYNFNNSTINSGSGNIYLNGSNGGTGNGSISTAAGNINLEAGNGIQVGAGSIQTATGNIDLTAGGGVAIGTGSVLTAAGGNINVTALSGDILAGTSFGGISTLGGGNLVLDAVNGSVNPGSSLKLGSTFGVSGAFGSGDVTVNAANQICGTFNVANGTGELLAGVSVANNQPTVLNSSADIGGSTSSQQVSLQLVSGSWNVWAGNSIYLSAVSNPSGTYSKNAAANFWAGNGIRLLGQNGPLYAPQLSLNAGAGGITIASQITLAPSSAGGLHITTRAGGDVLAESADPSTQSGIIMSDLGSANPNPVTLDVSGSIYGLTLKAPTFADINVAGNTYNFNFVGQNVSTAQSTTINVAGDIVYPGSLHDASVTLADALPNSVLNSTELSGDLGVGVALTYNASSQQLAINGLMTKAALDYLVDPARGLDAAQRAAVLALYADTQAPGGLALFGPGNFNITARKISLGISGGITVDFPDAPSAALDAISPYGANIKVTTPGNLDLTASTIANGGLLGGIDLTVGGTLDVGGTATALGSASAPKGIFTTSGGNVSVNAVGNINVDGSRIAAFNGGNVDVTSQTGDVNAGTGGQGSVVLQALQLDPATGLLVPIGATIPFSGIFATTVPKSDAELGNITVSAPEGNINSSVGGILQIAFNNANTADNFINVTAGKDINSTGSGVIGYNVTLKAAGDIKGVVVGIQSVAVTSQQSVDVTAVSGGNVDITASGTVSGTIIGGGDVSVSGSAIDAAVRGGSVSTSGDTSGASVGIPSAGPAQNVQASDNANTVAAKTDAGEDDDFKKKKGISLAQKASRVTVLLPPKN